MIPKGRPRAARVALAAALVCLLPSRPRGAEVESPFLSVDQIRPGMVGVGRTVFQGHTPEEFEVEILGVLRNAIGPQQHMILSRLHGKSIERTGVISGMSGSPVTVNGKVIGAVSYRLGVFEKEAIAGITPIADMLKAADLPTRSSAADARALLEEWADGAVGNTGAAPAPWGIRVPGFAGDLIPISTPLVFAGFPEAVVRQATPLFQSRGLEPVQGGGGTGGAGADYPIEPGVPVAAELVRGDLSLAGTGTLTHVEGNRIWAFGHPLLDIGAVAIPMARAEILVTYPSGVGSFKISNTTSQFGTLVQDRLTAIHGIMGPAPRMIPVSVNVDSPAGRRRLGYEVFENRALTPTLLAITTQASLLRVLEYSAEVTLRAQLQIETDGHEPLRYSSVETDLGSLQGAAAAEMARDVATVFNVLYGNRFEEARVKAVRLEVSSIPQARLARIGEVAITPTYVRPGGTIAVRTSLQPFRGEPLIREFKVRIPPDTPRGQMTVVVSSARNLNALEGNVLQRRFSGASDLDQMIRFVNGLRADDTLYVQLVRRSLGAVVQGEALPTLPLSILFTLGSNRFSGEESAAPDLPVYETSQKSEFVLLGGRRTSVEVR